MISISVMSPAPSECPLELGQECPLQPPGVQPVSVKGGMADHRTMHVDIGVDTRHVELVERSTERVDCHRSFRPVHDDLCEQRVIVRRHHVTLERMRVDVYVRARRPGEAIDPTWTRPEAGGGILCVDPALDRVPCDDDIFLGEVERVAGRESEWARTMSTPVTISVTVCSTWIPSVDLEEREPLTLEVDQELDRASVHVAERTAERDRGGRDPLAERRRDTLSGASSMSF